MKLESIEISNYKSIKDPIRINLADGRMHTFIGKNGSGKTNVLKALKIALSGRLSYRDKSEEGINAEYTYSLTDEEYAEYFRITEDKEASKTIRVKFSGTDPKIKWVNYPAIEMSVKEYKIRMQQLLEDFKVAAAAYVDIVEEFEGNDYGYDAFTDLKVESDGKPTDSSVFQWHIRNIRRRFVDQIKELTEFLSSFEEDVLQIDYDRDYSFRDHYHSFGELELMQLKSGTITMGGLTAQVLKVDKQKLQQANNELAQVYKNFNKRVKDARKKVNAILKEFEKIKQEIFNIYRSKEDEYYDGHEALRNRQRTFRDKLKETLYPKVYLLDNEVTMLFYTREEYDSGYSRENARELYINTRSPILQAFDNFLKDRGAYEEKESIFNDHLLKKGRLEELVEILNEEFLGKFKPEFDGDVGYMLEVHGGRMQLFVIEKDGTEVPFNDTSLGRRWYLSYLFIKNLLSEGDYLLIDEPAVFLHPQAQIEIFKDLRSLSKKGINVFISTHSPYLISNNWKYVYNVAMGENGTEVEKFGDPDELCEEIHKELIGFNTTNILFNLPKTIFFVEGTSDRVCIEKFAELLGYDLSKYHIYVCDGSAIILLFHLCRRYNIRFIMVADNDNKFKAKSYKDTHPDYLNIIKEMEACPDICHFVGEDKKGCLESLFASDAGKSFFNGKGKINDKKIAEIDSLNEFSKETVTNFKNIFKHFQIPKIPKVKK